MDVILHIGVAKTGTTHIQKKLLESKEALGESGFHLVPDLGTPNNFKAPLLGYCAAAPTDDLLSYWGIHSQEDLEQAQARTVDSIGSIASSRGTALISSEHFQSRLTTRRHVLALRDRLDKSDLTVAKIIVYVRNPIELAKSLHSTAIRCGSTAIEVPPATTPHYRNLCHHHSTVRRWQDAFRESRLVLRRYLQHPDFDVWRDFIHCGLGLPNDNRLFLNRGNLRSNQSLSENSLVMMCAVNRTMKRAIGDSWTSQRALQFSRQLSGLAVDEKIKSLAELHVLLQEGLSERRFSSEVELIVAEKLGKAKATDDLEPMTLRYRQSLELTAMEYARAFNDSDEAVRREFFGDLARLWQ